MQTILWTCWYIHNVSATLLTAVCMRKNINSLQITGKESNGEICCLSLPTLLFSPDLHTEHICSCMETQQKKHLLSAAWGCDVYLHVKQISNHLIHTHGIFHICIHKIQQAICINRYASLLALVWGFYFVFEFQPQLLERVEIWSIILILTPLPHFFLGRRAAATWNTAAGTWT